MSQLIPDLFAKFIAGDEQAFTELVKKFQKRIYFLAYKILGNHLDADEVAQETFVRIYNKRKDLANVRNFTTFVLRVATNYSIDLLRKRRGQARMTDDSMLSGEVQLDLSRKVESPSRRIENRQLMDEIIQALSMLPPKQRITVVMHDIEGYTKAEIAETFNCPQGTVRSNLHIARTKLKKLLQQRLDEKEQE